MEKTLIDKAEALGRKLMEQPVYKDLAAKEIALEEDSLTQELLEKVRLGQEELQRKQQEGTLELKDLQELKSVQEEVNNSTAFKEYTEAYQKVAHLIEEVNKELSAYLGFDFALFARNSKGCC